MAKFVYYDMENPEALCLLGKALAAPERIQIMQLLYTKKLMISEIASELNLPVSSTAFHLRMLEQAGLITIENQSGTRGRKKYCYCNMDHIAIDLVKKNTNINEIFSMEMPIGAFSSCRVTPTCGLWAPGGIIGIEDSENGFYYPERMNAAILWTSSGFVEYKFANGLPKHSNIKRISLSMEICSEVHGYKEDWKSDITVWVNGVECGTWTSPGDFGRRRGRLTPLEWPGGRSQYGIRVVWEIDWDGTYINGELVSQAAIKHLRLQERAYIAVRIGNKPEARYVGGFNLFGKSAGDYEQDIILTVEY